MEGTKMLMVKSFVIDRTKWLRGEGNTPSCLLRRTDEKMCCVGILCSQSGYTPTAIRGVRDLETLDSGNDLAFHLDEIYATNDNKAITADYRESKLTKLFAKLGITVEFSN
jgi:hypothetical protein